MRQKLSGCIMNQDQLELMLRWWQEQLRLWDWDIEVRFARGADIDMASGRVGECDYHATKKEAFIKILAPDNYHSYGLEKPQDMETTLVHELLHLHMAMICNPKADSRKDRDLEITIDSLSKTLVGLRRAGTLGPEGCKYLGVEEPF